MRIVAKLTVPAVPPGGLFEFIELPGLYLLNKLVDRRNNEVVWSEDQLWSQLEHDDEFIENRPALRLLDFLFTRPSIITIDLSSVLYPHIATGLRAADLQEHETRTMGDICLPSRPGLTAKPSVEFIEVVDDAVLFKYSHEQPP
jgi:hypothetical protein